MELRQRRQSDINAVDIELLELAADLNSSSYLEIQTPNVMQDSEERLLTRSQQVAPSDEIGRAVAHDTTEESRIQITQGETPASRLNRLQITPPEVRSGYSTSAVTVKPTRPSMVYVPTHRDAVRGWMMSWFGVYLEVINTVLSVMCCIFYLAELYDPQGYNAVQLRVVEIGATIYFGVHYLLHLYTEDDLRAFVFSFNGIIDMTIVPSLVMYFLHDNSTRQITLFRVFRVFRALRVLRLHNLIQSRKHGYAYEWGVFVFSLSAIIFVAAGIFHALEDYPDRSKRLDFHDSLYYILVTLSTIGYGDITPTHTLSEFFVMGLIICVVTTVPAQISRLHALHVATHAYDGRYEGRPGRGHVVVCGHVAHDSFADFLTEFYHPSRGVINFDVLVLCEEPPSAAMTRLLSNVIYATKTKYLKGSLVHEADRKRVKLDAAEAVFVLANKDTSQTEMQDATTLLQALSIRNFADSMGCRLRVYLQMISEKHNELSHIVGANQTLNSIRWKADIVSRGVVCPGSCALILNLMQSVDQAKLRKHFPAPSPWLQEYIHGMSQQIYAVLFTEAFDGHRYEDVARRFYQGFEVVLLAVYRRDEDDDHPHVTLSPFGKTMREGDIGFILSSSAAVVHDLVTEYANLAQTDIISPWSPRSSSRNVSLPFVSKSNLLQRASPTQRKIKLDSSPAAFPSSKTDLDSTEEMDKNSIPYSLTLAHRLRQAIRQDVSKMRGHYLVCGSNRHVLHLIDLLRNMHRQLHANDPTPTIVCLLDEIPTHGELDRGDAIDFLENVYFVRGHATKCADLLRVAAPYAQAVLMFPSDAHSVQENVDSATYLLDYGVVTSLLCLETACDSSLTDNTSVDRSARDEMDLYALHDLSLAAVKHRMQSHFPTLSPDLFRAPSLEQLQDRLNDSIHPSQMNTNIHRLCDLPSVSVLLRGVNIKFCRPRDNDINSDSWPYLSPAYAAGRIFVDSRLDLMLCQSFYNPYITEILHGLTGSPSDDPSSSTSSLTPNSPSILYQEDLPSDFVGGTFGELFKMMLRHGKLVIGLYRYPHRSLGNSLPYVVTSPSSDCRIHCHDKLFIVGVPQSPPNPGNITTSSTATAKTTQSNEFIE